MFGTLLKIEFLKYGRSTWLPMLLIFYNAILAFLTILLLYFRAEAYQESFYYNASPYLQQFIIVSSTQIVFSFFIIPMVFSNTYNTDKENHIQEQLALIPGTMRKYIYAKCIVSIAVNMTLFLSSMPILLLSCIYSDISFLKLVRLGAVVLLFSAWSAGFTAIFSIVSRKSGGAVIATTLMELLFCMGTVFVISMVGNYYLNHPEISTIPTLISTLCIMMMLMNPFCSYMGYYGNLTGNIGIMSRLCGQVGIDSGSKWFSMLFYKGTIAVLICVTISIILFAGRLAEKSCTNVLKNV